MARGVNKVILIGNVGKEPDCRAYPNGDAVTTVTLATSESWKDKQTGENVERTEWHRVVFSGRLGEIARDYVRKGSKIYVEGSIRSHKFQKDGVDQYRTEIRALSLELLDSGGENRRQSSPESNSPAQLAGGFGGEAFGDDAFDDNILF